MSFNGKTFFDIDELKSPMVCCYIYFRLIVFIELFVDLLVFEIFTEDLKGYSFTALMTPLMGIWPS